MNALYMLSHKPNFTTLLIFHPSYYKYTPRGKLEITKNEIIKNAVVVLRTIMIVGFFVYFYIRF